MRHSVRFAVLGCVLVVLSFAYGQAHGSRPHATTLVVPPYLDILVLDVLHPAPGMSVMIYPSGADEPLRGGTPGVHVVPVGDVLSTFVVDRPAPGRWTVRSSHEAVRARIMSQVFLPRGRLRRPAGGAIFQPGADVEIAYQVLDRHERPLKELPDHPLFLSMELTRPDGANEVVRMERRPDLGETVFAAPAPARAVLAGRYWTGMRVTTLDASGRSVQLFRDRWSGFSVEPGREH